MLTVLAFFTLYLNPASAEVPLRQPQLAADGHTAVLAYGAGKSIFVAVSSDQGATFSKPVKVAEAEVLPLGRHRGPRVAVSGSTIVVTAVVGKRRAEGPHAHGLPGDGDLMAWYSSDRGATWSAGRPVNDVPSAAREGLHTLAGDGRGRVFAAWLDLRRQGTRLYGAFSKDGGATWNRNVLVYESPGGTICECCHPSASFSPSGSLWVMWRNSLEGSRDLYATHSDDFTHFSPAQKLGNATWPLKACPMDGGGIAAGGNQVVTAWRRESDIYRAEPGKPETMLGAGKDPAIAQSGDQTFIVWNEGGGIVLWSNGSSIRKLSQKGAFPSITGLPGASAVTAWEQDGGIAVEVVHSGGRH